MLLFILSLDSPVVSGGDRVWMDRGPIGLDGSSA